MDLVVVEVLRLPISHSDVSGNRTKPGQAAFELLSHALKILQALASGSTARSQRLFAEEELFWQFFSTNGNPLA